MYGEGNTSKLVDDITKSTSQISEGLTAGLGIDIKSVLAGALGTKMLLDGKADSENKLTANVIDAVKDTVKEVVNEKTVSDEVSKSMNKNKNRKVEKNSKTEEI
jgi:hypothetical protein